MKPATNVQVPSPRVVGRYALFGEIASGGMATVHFGRLVGSVGFSRTVAIKRLHPQFAKDPEFVSMFLDEAKLAARIQHPNVVTTLDVTAMGEELFLVMEYVQGESLSRLLRNAGKRGERLTPNIASAIVAGALFGLHAAHEAKSEQREALNIVHRDVSPQNVLVGVDGVARVLDFGVAKAALRSQSTRGGQMKGKLSYMSPEQLNGKAVDRRTDVFAAGVVLWESLTARRLFDGADPGEIMAKVLTLDLPEPKTVVPNLPQKLNDIVMKGLARDANQRYQTARDFAIALEDAVQLSTAREIGEWVERVGGEGLAERAAVIGEIESFSLGDLEPAMESAPAHPMPLVNTKQTMMGMAPAPRSRPSMSSSPGHAPPPPSSQPGYAMPPPLPSGPQFPTPSGQNFPPPPPLSGPDRLSSVDLLGPSGLAPPSALSLTAPFPTEAVPTPPPQTTKSPALGILLGVGGGALLGGVALFLVLRGKPEPIAPAPVPQVVQTVADPVPVAPTPTGPAAPTATVAPPPPVATAVTPPPTPPPVAAPNPQPQHQAPQPQAKPSPTPTPTPTKSDTPEFIKKAVEPTYTPTATPTKPAKKAGGCNPPWVIDRKGIKRLKPECL